MQDEEEQARLRASSLLIPSNNTSELLAEAGTLGETLDADAKWGKTLDERHKQKIMREVEQLRHANLVKKLEQNLSLVSTLISGKPLIIVLMAVAFNLSSSCVIVMIFPLRFFFKLK